MLQFPDKNAFVNPVNTRFGLGILLYCLLFATLYLVLYFFNYFTTLPDSSNIIKWDAQWYSSITLKGYEYYWFMPSSSAFFPLFAYTWKVLHLGSISISLLNFLFYVSSIYALYRTFSIELPRLLVYMSLPSGIFFFIPYSEAFFFLFTTVFLVGLYRNDQKMILAGLLLSSLTRATAMFFLPAIIVMELFNAPRLFDRQAIRNIVLYALASLLGLAIVVLFQYMKTHEWFAFAKQQIRFWGHRFSIPAFPLVSHGGQKSIWLDTFAFFAGLSAAFVLLIFFVRKFFIKNYSNGIFTNRPFWFSASYVFMLLVYSLFFNTKCLDFQTTIDSMNRYVFSTSFFLLFFVYMLRYFPAIPKNYLYFFGLFALAAVSCGLGGTLVFFSDKASPLMASLLFFAVLFVYVCFHYAISHRRYGHYISFTVFVLNLLLSCFALHNFITSNWAG